MKNVLVKQKNKLTSWEWEGLNNGYNIADGHAHHEQKHYKKVVKKLSSLYLNAEKETQNQIQSDFEKAFFELAGQRSYRKLHRPLYQYACSISIEVVANYLRLKKMSVGLLHPTFDNLADILKRHHVKLKPIEEYMLYDVNKYLKALRTDAIFLVCPNNPTGLELTKREFKNIVDFCKKENKLLILDQSFRFYSSYTTWDQYKTLIESGISFIVLEDTGKTWPTLELKLGITVCSNDIYDELNDINNDFVLNVSPFTFKLLTHYILAEGLEAGKLKARRIVNENRSYLLSKLENTPITVVNPKSSLSVVWVKLPKGWKGSELAAWLANKNIHVLPGFPFYWNDHRKGESFIRVALLRPTSVFKKAAEDLRNQLLKYRR